MDENLLVRILVPTTDGKSRLGTGYPVARDRILTARHVVAAQDRDDSQPIQVHWHPVETASATANGRVLWQGGVDFDAAVLECQFPNASSDWGVLSEQEPALDARWSSCGFARAGKTSAQRKMIGMTGRVLAVRDNQARLELGVEYPPEQREAWQGASGSPVFVQGRICGVVAACEENFRGNRLEATAVWRLVQVAEFRTAIGYDDRAGLLADIRQSIASRLERSLVAMGVLGRELHVANPSGKAATWAADLADVLVILRIEELIRKTNQAHGRLFDRSGKRILDDGGAIEEVACLLLPVVFDYARIQSVRTRVAGTDAVLLSFPAATTTLAEIIMAGVDGRPAAFGSAVTETDFPAGALRLTMPPECGWDPRGEGFRSAWHEHLAAQFVSQELRERYRQEENVLANFAAGELAHLASLGRTHYLVFDLRGSDAERSAWSAVIRDLKAQYPAIVFIDLRHDGEQAADECKLLRPLRDLLWQSRNIRAS